MRQLALIILLLFLSASKIAAKEWRGLLPMHSTRLDVERLLGEPPSTDGTSSEGRPIYSTEEGTVSIVFSDGQLGGSCVAPGTVLMVQVRPKHEMLVSDLRLDEKKFRKFDPSQPADLGYEAYINNEEGFLIRAYKGTVDEMIYFASASDRTRCSSFYQNIEDAVRVLVCGLVFGGKFDEYGKLSWSDEKARLDNFAIQLQNTPDVRAHIIVYAGLRATVGEAQTSAQRAKDYLISNGSISSERITAIDGGHRETLSTELFILSAGAEDPTPMPTIEPDKVELIYDTKPRPKKKG